MRMSLSDWWNGTRITDYPNLSVIILLRCQDLNQSDNELSDQYHRYLHVIEAAVSLESKDIIARLNHLRSFFRCKTDPHPALDENMMGIPWIARTSNVVNENSHQPFQRRSGVDIYAFGRKVIEHTNTLAVPHYSKNPWSTAQERILAYMTHGSGQICGIYVAEKDPFADFQCWKDHNAKTQLRIIPSPNKYGETVFPCQIPSNRGTWKPYFKFKNQEVLGFKENITGKVWKGMILPIKTKNFSILINYWKIKYLTNNISWFIHTTPRLALTFKKNTTPSKYMDMKTKKINLPILVIFRISLFVYSCISENVLVQTIIYSKRDQKNSIQETWRIN